MEQPNTPIIRNEPQRCTRASIQIHCITPRWIHLPLLHRRVLYRVGGRVVRRAVDYLEVVPVKMAKAAKLCPSVNRKDVSEIGGTYKGCPPSSPFFTTRSTISSGWMTKFHGPYALASSAASFPTTYRNISISIAHLQAEIKQRTSSKLSALNNGGTTGAL